MTMIPPFRPGVVVSIPADQSDNRVRTSPARGDDNSNVTAWLQAGKTRAVILEAPAGWPNDYPYQNDGYLWVYVYAAKAIDHSRSAKKKLDGVEVEVVGWTALYSVATSEYYLQRADITAISG